MYWFYLNKEIFVAEVNGIAWARANGLFFEDENEESIDSRNATTKSALFKLNNGQKGYLFIDGVVCKCAGLGLMVDDAPMITVDRLMGLGFRFYRFVNKS